MNWGIYDTKDKLWIGDNSGPRLFPEDQHDIAVLAAEIVAVQLGHAITRYRAREFFGWDAHLVDEINTKMTPEEALKCLEEGKL